MKHLPLRSSAARAVLSAAVMAATVTGFAACSADGDLDLGPDATSSDASTPDTSLPPADDAGSDAPVTTPSLCGNKKVDKGEECDDGNTANDDGCSSACKIESAGPTDVCTGAGIPLTQVDGSTLYTGQILGTTTGLFNHYASACGGGSGPDAVYRIDPPMTGRATVRITAGFSAILSARTGCTDAKSELGCADDSLGTGTGTSLAFPVFQGAPVFVFVDGYGGSGGEFSLDIELQTAICGNGKAELPETCDDGNTNDGDGCSSTCSLEDSASVSACPGMGYRLAATPSNAGLVSFAGDTSTMSNSGGNSSECAFNGRGKNATYAITPTVTGNLSLTLLANYPRALLHVRRECSTSGTQVDCSGADNALVPLKTSIPVFAEQTVYVFVDGDEDAEGLYTLDAKLSVAACGNGLLDPGEECDDGNTADSDGCSATCAAERPDTTYACHTGADAGSEHEGQPLRLEGAAPGPRSLSVTGTTAPKPGDAPVSQSTSCGASDKTVPDYIYEVTSDIDGWATVRVKGVFNVAVAAKDACNATKNLACADVAGGSEEEVLTFAMDKEKPYFIVVDGAAVGQQGFFQLDMEVVPSVCGNSVVEGGETCDDGATADGDGCSATCILETDKARDKCATAPPLPPTPDDWTKNPDGTYSTSIASGTTGLVHDISLTSCTSQGPDAFFAVTAPESGVLTATITSATFRTTLGARSACTGSAQLVCDATKTDGGQVISFSVTKGNKYYLIVDGQNVTGRLNYGRFTMDVKVTPTGCGDTFVSPPEQCDDGNLADGDGCSSTCTVETLAGANACDGHAVTLTGTGSEVRRGTVTVDTTSLPSKTGSICGGSGPEGILKITPDIDGQILIRSTGPADRVLYARTTCGDPATEMPKDCDELRTVSGPVQKNTPLYVFVDGLNGAAGTTTLQITVTP